MTGTIPAAGDLSMDDLAGKITAHEQTTFTRMTALAIDPTKVGNLVTYVADDDQLGAIAIVDKGDTSDGTLITSTTAFILGAKTAVDVYRLALS